MIIRGVTYLVLTFENQYSINKSVHDLIQLSNAIRLRM